jgi:hypothetical protein
VPIGDNVRISIAIFSYLDRFSFGITADYNAAPDLDVLVKGIRRGLAELQAQSSAVRRAAAPGGAKRPAATPAKRPAAIPAKRRATGSGQRRATAPAGTRPRTAGSSPAAITADGPGQRNAGPAGSPHPGPRPP